MWRVVLRISYTSDMGSGLRNDVVPFLHTLRLQHTATGTFESASVDRRHCWSRTPFAWRWSAKRRLDSR